MLAGLMVIIAVMELMSVRTTVVVQMLYDMIITAINLLNPYTIGLITLRQKITAPLGIHLPIILILVTILAKVHINQEIVIVGKTIKLFGRI